LSFLEGRHDHRMPITPAALRRSGHVVSALRTGLLWKRLQPRELNSR